MDAGAVRRSDLRAEIVKLQAVVDAQAAARLRSDDRILRACKRGLRERKARLEQLEEAP